MLQPQAVSSAAKSPYLDAYLHSEVDLSPTELRSRSETLVTVGGNIRSLEVDPSGHRVVVSFFPTKPGSELLVVFETVLNSNLSLSLSFLSDEQVLVGSMLSFALRGFIRGPPKNDTTSQSAALCRFRPNYPSGALLATAWMNGKISFYPMYFVTYLSTAHQH